MLQVQTLPASLAGMLWTFRWCFTEPSYRTFTALLAGMVAQPGRRTVCGMLTGAGLSRLWHHSRAHWFFSHARWSTERVGLVLVGLIVAGLLPGEVPVLVAVDDTLMRRSGRKVAGAAWQHDGARKGPKGSQVSWGTCFRGGRDRRGAAVPGSAGVPAGAGPAVAPEGHLQGGAGLSDGGRDRSAAARPAGACGRRRALRRC